MYKALILVIFLSGCSTLADFAMSAVSPNKGGINTELVVGDKEQTLGANQEVKADQVGKVVGANDNSTVVGKTNKVEVTNNNIPFWVLAVLLLGWILPTPTGMFQWMRSKWQVSK